MMVQHSDEIFICVKKFFVSCFSYLKNPNTDICSSDLNEDDIKNLKIELEKIVEKYKSFTNEHPEDVFFLLTHRAIRAAVNDFVSMSVYNNSALLEGITTESEIDFLFFNLENEYHSNDAMSVTVERLLSSCLSELYEIESEYQILMVYIHNTMKVSSENYLRSSNRLLSEQQALVIELDAKRRDLNARSDRLNERIDGTFKRLEAHEQDLESAIKTNDTKISSLVKKINGSEKRMYEANVTILGIFSAIVLTFSTTVNFFSAVVSSFSGASSYKFFLILLVVGLISVCALAGLFHYLWKVREDRQLISLIKLLTPPKESAETKNKKRLSHIHIFKTTIAILLALMAIISIAWGFGLIERRNSYVSNKLSIRSLNASFEDNSLLSDNNIK